MGVLKKIEFSQKGLTIIIAYDLPPNQNLIKIRPAFFGWIQCRPFVKFEFVLIPLLVKISPQMVIELIYLFDLISYRNYLNLNIMVAFSSKYQNTAGYISRLSRTFIYSFCWHPMRKMAWHTLINCEKKYVKLQKYMILSIDDYIKLYFRVFYHILYHICLKTMSLIQQVWVVCEMVKTKNCIK